jgi:hypothetical protein
MGCRGGLVRAISTLNSVLGAPHFQRNYEGTIREYYWRKIHFTADYLLAGEMLNVMTMQWKGFQRHCSAGIGLLKR